jgi:GT2 family glycosyltransferase
MKKIALIIPVFNRLEHTKECLHNLKEQESSDFWNKNHIYTILVDDGSTDGTREWVHENYPGVVLLQGDGDLWWSGAMNVGIDHALNELGCEFVHLWENDILPVGPYFDELQKVISSWDGRTVACSKVYYRGQPDVIFAMGGSFNRRNGRKVLIGRNQHDDESFQTEREVDWFLGQGVLIHREVYKKVGGFDRENFPQYYGDMDFALRCQDAGYVNRVYPQLKLLNDTATTGISHKKDQTLKDLYLSLTSIRSNLNVRRDVKFYRIHATSFLAYQSVIRRYYIFLGSYFKWKFLGWFGIRKKDDKFY